MRNERAITEFSFQKGLFSSIFSLFYYKSTLRDAKILMRHSNFTPTLVCTTWGQLKAVFVVKNCSQNFSCNSLKPLLPGVNKLNFCVLDCSRPKQSKIPIPSQLNISCLRSRLMNLWRSKYLVKDYLFVSVVNLVPVTFMKLHKLSLVRISSKFSIIHFIAVKVT